MSSNFILDFFNNPDSFSSMYDDENEVDEMKYDFTKKEDVDEFCKVCDELKNSVFVKDLLNVLYGGDDYLDYLKELVNKKYEESRKNAKPEQKPSPQPEKTSETKAFTYQEGLPIESKLQIHKLVQEYLDKVIKPQVNNQVSNDALNDAYVAFYDYSCWLMAHK